MARNNLIAIFIHLILCVVAYVKFAELFEHSVEFFHPEWITIIILFLYFISGILFIDQGSKIKNLKSVSSVSTILFIVVSISYIIGSLDNLFLIILYYVFIPFIQFQEVGRFFICTVSFLPSLLMWAGLEFKLVIRRLTIKD
jgi:ABC-type Na+ efflux pump permease subunit